MTSPAIKFDGTNGDYIKTSTRGGGLNSFTICCWVYVIDDNDNDRFTVLSNYNGNIGFILGKHGNSGYWRFHFNGKQIWGGPEKIQEGKWYHIAGSYDANNDIIEGNINGSALGIDDAPSDTSQPSDQIEFGSRPSWPDEHPDMLHGFIDDVRLYNNRTISDTEPVRDIMYDRSDITPDRHWTMDEGYGSTTREIIQGVDEDMRSTTWGRRKVGAKGSFRISENNNFVDRPAYVRQNGSWVRAKNVKYYDDSSGEWKIL